MDIDVYGVLVVKLEIGQSCYFSFGEIIKVNFLFGGYYGQ